MSECFTVTLWFLGRGDLGVVLFWSRRRLMTMFRLEYLEGNDGRREGVIVRESAAFEVVRLAVVHTSIHFVLTAVCFEEKKKS
jgi:hypothetical protein